MAGVVFLLILLTSCVAQRPGMAGVWEIQEEERTYEATLDEKGNGPYTWKEGRIQTTEFIDRVLPGPLAPALRREKKRAGSRANALFHFS